MQYGFLFAAPYAVTAVIMVLNSWHSDKTRERRGHVALVYTLSGVSLILSVLTREHFWLSYAFMCLAIPGPFAALAPFWAIPTETLPRNVFGPVIGLVNALGNTGGFAGPYIVGWLKTEYHSTAIPFNALGIGMLVAAALAFLLPKSAQLSSSQFGQAQILNQFRDDFFRRFFATENQRVRRRFKNRELAGQQRRRHEMSAPVFQPLFNQGGGPVRCTNWTRGSPAFSASRYFAFNAEHVSTENSFAPARER